MFKNHPIDTVRVEHVTAHTVVLDVQTAAPLHLVWPNVRGNYADVPYGLRAVSTVFQKKMGTEDFGEVREALIADVSWRWDKGYVVAAKYSKGWVFAWSEGERDG